MCIICTHYLLCCTPHFKGNKVLSPSVSHKINFYALFHLFFFHFSIFLVLLPPSSPFRFLRGETVDCQWPWSGDLKDSAVKSSSSSVSGDLCNTVPSRLARASLFSLFTSRFSLLLSGHVFLLPARLSVSSFTLLPSLTVWLPVSLFFVVSGGCRSGTDAVFSSSGNSAGRKRPL